MADGKTPVLSDEDMRALGFTDHRPGHWYLVRRVGDAETLNITIDKQTGDYNELVMDEYFGQPAPYGTMVEPFRTRTRDAVEAILAELNDAGLRVAVDHAEYGWCPEQSGLAGQ